METLSKKVTKAELDINFLKSCQRFNVLPTCECFPLPNVSKHDVFEIRKRLLESALNKRSKEKRKLQYEKDKIKNKIKKVLPGMEFYIFKKALQNNIDQEFNCIVCNHYKKLKALTKNCVLPLDSSEALKFGLSHSIFPPNTNKIDIYASLNSIYQLQKAVYLIKVMIVN